MHFWSFRALWKRRSVPLAVVVLTAVCVSASAQQAKPALPRTRDGKPSLEGIWQAQSRAAYDLQAHAAGLGIPAGESVVEGRIIPYLPAAAAKRAQNFANRQSADPLGKCYMPGVPRIMYMEHPFQIFQTPDNIAIAFEWSLVFRLIHTDGKPPLHPGFDSWMGDSRGHWEGDTLVVTVTDQNDKTWFDLAGDFHSDALRVTERYTLLDADNIRYEATIEDGKVFARPWKITVPLVRQKNVDRLLEYECQAEKEEVSGDFERDPRTWYPAPGTKPADNPDATATLPPSGPLPALKPAAKVTRTADGKPDFSGYYQPNGGGANYGLEHHEKVNLIPPGRGVIIEPADGLLPYRPWAAKERADRVNPQRGYDDPTAHCFPGGIPRSFYTPSPYQIVQTPNYLVVLFERMSWRIIPIVAANDKTRTHLSDSIRLWQGDAIGHWEGDTLVVDASNFNGRAWHNEVGDISSYTLHVVERFAPGEAGNVVYRATITDPIVYTRPFTIEIPLAKGAEELLEVACHEDNGDLQHLKDIRDEYRAAHPAK